jgi:hypothetical protein
MAIGDESRPHNQVHSTVKSLRTLLAWIKNLAKCPGYHDVLLQLPEWDTASSCELRRSHLGLYLSTSCCEPLYWQESRLQEQITRQVVCQMNIIFLHEDS